VESTKPMRRSRRQIAMSRSGRLLLTLAILFRATGLSWAQVDQGLRFEVASVRPHVDDGTGNAGFSDNLTSVRMANLSLRALVRIAYGVLDEQIDAPGWLNNTSFDIVAKPPEKYESRQLPTLLRNLLADRFRMAVHRERKEVSGYALRLLPGGQRLQASTDP